MRNRLVPHPGVADKNQEGYLKNEESQPLTRASSSGFPVPGRAVAITSGCKIQW